MPETTWAGHLLIASSQMLDPSFARSVVLIVQHDPDEGALGVILNRPLELSVAEAVGDTVEQAQEVMLPIHQGGPCDGPLAVLHTDALGGGDEVVPGVRFTMDREQIITLMECAPRRIKYFAGYAGWAQQQLEEEIATGAWLLTPADADHLFDDRANQWSRLSTWLAVGKQIPPDRIPDDPSMN